VIGGLQQTGNYKIGCRFNKADLIRKVRRIADYQDQIALTCMDAAKFVKKVLPKSSSNTLVNLDPPYFGKGPELYTNFYTAADHAKLADAVSLLKRRWIVTYDDTPEIRKLYDAHPTYSSSLNYSAQIKRVGVELLVADRRLKLSPSFASMEITCTGRVMARQPAAMRIAAQGAELGAKGLNK
jgi:DNA adenine methylase